MNANAYTMNALLQSEVDIRQHGVSFCQTLQRLAQEGNPTDLGLIFQYLAADVVGALAFGSEDGLGMLSNLKDENKFLSAVEEVSTVVASIEHHGGVLIKAIS